MGIVNHFAKTFDIFAKMLGIQSNTLAFIITLILVFIAILILDFCWYVFIYWESDKNQKESVVEAMLALKIPPDEAYSEESLQVIYRYISEKYSSEFIKNRFSDFCGSIRMVWDLIGALFRYAFIIILIWKAISEDNMQIFNALFAIVVALFFFIPSLIFSLFCKVLTGRYPGQARKSRSLVVDAILTRSKLI
jgi:hypothetical protein